MAVPPSDYRWSSMQKTYGQKDIRPWTVLVPVTSNSSRPRWPRPARLASLTLARLVLAGWLVLAAGGGCAKLPSHAKRPIGGARPPGGVALELFFVRYRAGDASVNTPLWSSVDDQQLPVDLRRRLAANGFLAGTLAAQPPPVIERLLNLDEHAAVSDTPPVIDPSRPSKVKHRLLEIYRREASSQIVLKGDKEPLPELTVLYSDEQAVRGRTFENAKGVFVTKVEPQPDGRVTLQLTPEIEYGEARQKMSPRDGGYTMSFVAPHKTFDDLRLSVTLSPGEMLVVGCRDDRLASLGYQLFTQRDDESLDQVLLLVRLAHAGSSELFADGVPESGE
jgi:hypothetical protein